jgi:ABC-type lipoprotein release transport system permease subunit
MGVLMAIGEKRWKLIGQFLTEILMIAVLAIGISALTGSLIAGQIGNQLLSQQIEQTSAGQSAGGMMGLGGGGFFGQRTAQVSAIDQLDIQVSFGDLMALGGIGLLRKPVRDAPSVNICFKTPSENDFNKTRIERSEDHGHYFRISECRLLV